MPADSLFDMARKACVRQARSLTDIGSIPYHLIRPALLKIESPDQLYQLEQNCPQLVGETGEIWLSMIKRDIPGWDTKPHQPSNPKNWPKVYRKLKKEAQLEMAAGEEKLKAALNNINANREQNTAQVINKSIVPRPTVNRRQQINYNYMSGRTGSKGAHKMTVLEKIRKDHRDANSKMSRPTHLLVQRAAVVKQAPKTFVEDLKQKKHDLKRPVKALPTKVVRPARPPMNAPAKEPAYNLMQDREARLQALKTGRPTSKPVAAESKATSHNGGLSLDFLETDDDNNDSFGDSTKTTVTSQGCSGRRLVPQGVMLKRKTSPHLFTASSSSKRQNVKVK